MAGRKGSHSIPVNKNLREINAILHPHFSNSVQQCFVDVPSGMDGQTEIQSRIIRRVENWEKAEPDNDTTIV